ncbi:hypothetical protein P7C71_g2906, partial [Lecanoromycetidae sp. Uapishka_2]
MIMKLSLLSSLFSSALALVLPAEDMTTSKVSERDLLERGSSYTTSISMASMRISYGNLKPADVLQHLSDVCTDQLTGCNYENTGPLTIATEMYVDKTTMPIAGNLILNPKGVFDFGNGSQFVDCIVKSAPFGTQCETQSWNQINPNPKSPTPKNSVGTASFCTMSNFIECSRTDSVTGDAKGDLQVGVSFSADPGSAFNFCSILSLASGLTDILGPFFGVAAFACGAAGGS